jgi:hypothetical protein
MRNIGKKNIKNKERGGENEKVEREKEQKREKERGRDCKEIIHTHNC